MKNSKSATTQQTATSHLTVRELQTVRSLEAIKPRLAGLSAGKMASALFDLDMAILEVVGTTAEQPWWVGHQQEETPWWVGAQPR